MEVLNFIDEIDGAIFNVVNGLNSPFLDNIMIRLTQEIYWLPLFVFLMYKLVLVYGKKSLWIILGLAVVIALADQVTSSIMKPFFERLRPSHNTWLDDSIHIVDNYRGGLYGFPSSHAANSFGVAFFLWEVGRRRISWIWILFIWAAIFSYTRIYLGVHYPGDIVAGALVGIGIGYATSMFARKFRGFHTGSN